MRGSLRLGGRAFGLVLFWLLASSAAPAAQDFRGTIEGKVTDNTANEGGGAIFFVSNNRTGSLLIEDSVLERNPSGKFETVPGIFVIAKANDDPRVTNSVVR